MTDLVGASVRRIQQYDRQGDHGRAGIWNPPIGTRLRPWPTTTSNTLMVAESAGRFNLTLTGNYVMLATGSPGGRVQMELTIYQWVKPTSGAGWADTFNGQEQVQGRPYDGGLSIYKAGSHPDRGPCAINCANERVRKGNGTGYGAGLYSYHAGGAHIVMCDGAVRFVNQNIPAGTLIAIISAYSGDIVGEF